MHENRSNTFVPVTISGVSALLSGVISLGLEIVWFRYFQLVFGNSIYATALITAFFMIGMAAGNAFWGKLADRTGNASFVLRIIFIGIAFYAVLSPALYRFLSVFSAHCASMHDAGIGVMILLGGIVLVIPAFLTGGVVPVLITAPNDKRAAAVKIGTLYGLYTLGGAAGACVIAFLLLPKLGLRGSLYGIGFIQVVLLLLTKMPTGHYHTQPSCRTVDNGANEDRRVSRKLLLVLFALSGFTALAYEVLWTRILILFFRNSMYDFALVLSATLSGMVIGSLWCGAVMHRIKRPLLWFAVAQVLIGCAAALSLMLVHTFPSTLSFLQSMADLRKMFGTSYWLMGNGIRFLAAFMIAAPQAILFGATFPLVSKVILVRTKIGEDFGTASALNGIGSAIGSLAAGFAFISMFGISGSVRITACINMMIGIGLLPFVLYTKKLKFTAIAGVLVMSILISAIIPRWDKLSMSQFLLNPRQKLPDLLDLLYYDEDASGIVSVVKFKPSGVKYLTTDRLFGQNSSAMNGPEDHRRLGYIPVILHGNARSTLLIGMGAGITLRGLVEARAGNITCVELSKNVCHAAEYFRDVNNNAMRDTAVRIINQDGRAYLSSRSVSYDVIIGDIFFPMSSGSGMVYSREFFELCKTRLSPGGLYCQWLPIHQLSITELQIVVATFLAVFPDAELWYGMTGKDLPVIGCMARRDGPLRVEFDYLLRYFDDPAKKAALCEIDLCDPMSFLSNYIASGAALKNFCAGAIYNTDDKPVIEFLNPRDYNTFKERGEKNREALRGIQENVFETGIVR
jgi:spermidine synthase